MKRLTVDTDKWRSDQVVNDGQCETGSLAGSSLSKTNQVPAGEREWDRLLLYRRGMGVTCVVDRVQDLWSQLELREGDWWPGFLLIHLPEIYPPQECQ